MEDERVSLYYYIHIKTAQHWIDIPNEASESMSFWFCELYMASGPDFGNVAEPFEGYFRKPSDIYGCRARMHRIRTE